MDAKKAVHSVRRVVHLAYVGIVAALYVVFVYFGIRHWWQPMVSSLLAAISLTFLYLSVTTPHEKRGEKLFAVSVVVWILTFVSFIVTVVWSIGFLL